MENVLHQQSNSNPNETKLLPNVVIQTESERWVVFLLRQSHVSLNLNTRSVQMGAVAPVTRTDI